jgi:large subunit ribosomal protein L15
MRLNEISDNHGARKARMRVGRGEGSGKGKTAGRGVKGQKSRSGVSVLGFEGGQMPIYRRTPKRGFNNIFSKKFEIINLGRLQRAIDDKKFDPKTVVNFETLASAGLIRGKGDGVRILAKGEIKIGVICEVAGATKSAVDAILRVGGKVTLPSLTKVEILSQKKSEKTAAKKLAAGPLRKTGAPDEGTLVSSEAAEENSKVVEE